MRRVGMIQYAGALAALAASIGLGSPYDIERQQPMRPIQPHPQYPAPRKPRPLEGVRKDKAHRLKGIRP